jgi:hypothetical protein
MGTKNYAKGYECVGLGSRGCLVQESRNLELERRRYGFSKVYRSIKGERILKNISEISGNVNMWEKA